MTIINIRGTSGSGKSTLVKRFLDEHPYTTIQTILGPWKKEKIVAYKCHTSVYKDPTYVIGRYETQCGGCDALSYKGSHPDIEQLVREASLKGNVIYEGLTISSTLTRWMNISKDRPGQFVWAFMSTDVEECHRRILARSGREPKRKGKNNLADYELKHRSCLHQMEVCKAAGERVIELSSDDEGYQKLLEVLNA